MHSHEFYTIDRWTSSQMEVEKGRVDRQVLTDLERLK